MCVTDEEGRTGIMSHCSSWVVWCGVLVGVLGCGFVMAEEQTLPVTSVSKAPGLVHQIKVVNDQAPDTSSLESIVDFVTRDCKTNDEKAVAIYNVNMLFNYHRAYPEEPGLVSALKEFNVYGWSLCGGLHTAQAALWRAAGWKWRYLGWPGHTTVEAFYDGGWHYLDVFLKFYSWKVDANARKKVEQETRTIVSAIFATPAIGLAKHCKGTR